VNTKIFISYSHDDAEVVTRFVQQLSLSGFDLWIDEKDIKIGDYYTSRIFSGIYDSDVYMVFISKNSVESSWVKAEIDFAVTKKIENGKLKVIAVKLDDAEIPITLSNADFYDARFSVGNAAGQFVKEFPVKARRNELQDGLAIANIGFTMSDTTNVEVSPFSNEFTMEDLEEDRKSLQKKMREKAYGILMNFVNIADFDFTAPVPKFMNGTYTEHVERVEGSTSGGICEKVSIKTTVYKPDAAKVSRLLGDRLDILNINEITFGISIPLNEGETLMEIGKRCYQKLQDNYIILAYNVDEGAKIALKDDFYLSMCITEAVIKIKLSTKYVFQFADRFRAFSVVDFIKSLLEE